MGDVCEFAGDVLDDLWGGIVDVAESIADLVTDAVDWLISAVLDTIHWIGDNIEIVIIALAVVVVIVFPPAWTAVVQIIHELKLVAATMIEWIDILTVAFADFAEFIHLTTILAVNEIAMLVSEDYRVMMQKFYSQLGAISAALGFVPQFLALAFRNARTVVLDASTYFGKSYDLAEITWLSSLNGFLKKFGEDTMRYSLNPEAVFTDLDAWIIKEASDGKSQGARFIITAIESVISVTEEIVTEISGIRSKVDTFVSDLPAFIKDEIKPFLDELTEPLDNFLEDVYRPELAKASKLIGALGTRMDDTKIEVGNIVDRLKKPGDLLLEIDKLAQEAKTEQEEKIFDASNRPLVRSGAAIIENAEEEQEKLQALIAVLEKPIEMMPYEVVEEVNPGKESIGRVPPDRTWFTGDY